MIKHTRSLRGFLAIAMVFIPQLFVIQAGFASENIITGDSILDASLQKINLRYENRPDKFIAALSKEYMLPANKINNLRAAYEFSLADVFLTVAITDITGQSIDIVSRAYIENKTAGWPYVLEQLGIDVASTEFDQIKEDADMYD